MYCMHILSVEKVTYRTKSLKSDYLTTSQRKVNLAIYTGIY